MPGQSGPGNNGNEGVLCIPQRPSITGASPSDCLVSYPEHSLGGLTPLYSTVPADWAINVLEIIHIFSGRQSLWKQRECLLGLNIISIYSSIILFSSTDIFPFVLFCFCFCFFFKPILSSIWLCWARIETGSLVCHLLWFYFHYESKKDYRVFFTLIFFYDSNIYIYIYLWRKITIYIYICLGRKITIYIYIYKITIYIYIYIYICLWRKITIYIYNIIYNYYIYIYIYAYGEKLLYIYIHV